MEEWLPLVKKSPLFYGINDDELYTLLKCCASEQVLYEDGEYIFRMGESVNTVLVLLRGKACVIQENFWGHQEHIYHIKEGELFGQSYTRFIHNMLRLVSEHNVKLENKLEHVCRRTTREKLLSYLSEQAMAKGGRDFDIPHNRQELAEYLCVDRSAMSSELSKMRAEGILDFQKNHFVLHDRDTVERGEGA